jgi:hypothetical protein
MIDNNNRSDPGKKDYTISLSEKETEKQLSLIFDPHICLECGQDHSFKNNFEDVETSIDDFLAYLKIESQYPYLLQMPIHQKKVVIKK